MDSAALSTHFDNRVKGIEAAIHKKIQKIVYLFSEYQNELIKEKSYLLNMKDLI